MVTKTKASTKKNLESKITELEAKLTKLATQLESKPTPKIVACRGKTGNLG